jgi:hypothetical protein
MKKILIITISVVMTILLFGYSSHVQNGNALANYVRAESISAAPAAPYTCDANHLADFVYKDDTNDGNEAYMCFCGQAVGGAYTWLDVHTVAACW